MQLFFTRAWISIYYFSSVLQIFWLPLLLPLLLLPPILFLFLPPFRRHLFLTEVPHHKHYQSLTVHLQILTSILRTLILHYLTLTTPPHNLQHLFHPPPPSNKRRRTSLPTGSTKASPAVLKKMHKSTQTAAIVTGLLKQCNVCLSEEEKGYWVGCDHKSKKCQYWVHDRCLGFSFKNKAELKKVTYKCPAHMWKLKY